MHVLKIAAGALAVVLGLAGAAPAEAGDVNGNFMVRVLGTVVDPASDVKSVVTPAGPIVGADADVSTQVIPALTLSYFFTNNWAVELFCCFSKHSIDGKGAIAGAGEIADTWIFPPVVTLQYHFDHLGAFKPYVGAGVQYIAFFDESTAANGLGADSVAIDNAWGFALQAGADISLGDGWYLNADVKKVFMDTDVTWQTAGGPVRASVDLDPWIFSAGVGYRFNLDDLFGRRAPVALK